MKNTWVNLGGSNYEKIGFRLVYKNFFADWKCQVKFYFLRTSAVTKWHLNGCGQRQYLFWCIRYTWKVFIGDFTTIKLSGISPGCYVMILMWCQICHTQWDMKTRLIYFCNHIGAILTAASVSMKSMMTITIIIHTV